MFKRILVPIDFSPPSLRALDDAVELGRMTKAEIVLVHAVDRVSYVGAGEMYGQFYDVSSLVRQFTRSGKERLAKVAAEVTKKRLKVRMYVEVGTPHEVILRAAKSSRADLILLSTHGRTGLAHVLLGSVAEKIVRHAPCPVLTVRGKGRSSARRKPAPAAVRARRK